MFFSLLMRSFGLIQYPLLTTFSDVMVFHDFWSVFMNFKDIFMGSGCSSSFLAGCSKIFISLSLPSSTMRFFAKQSGPMFLRCFWGFIEGFSIVCNYYRWSTTIGPAMRCLQCIVQVYPWLYLLCFLVQIIAPIMIPGLPSLYFLQTVVVLMNCEM